MAIQAGDDILASHFNTIVPIGVVLPYAGASAPTGFLLCDGAVVSRATYSALFGIIGETFGAGDGSTTFALPDMRSRVPVGAGAAPTKTLSFAHTAVDTSTDIITVASNEIIYTGTPIVFTTSGTLPTGISPATTYYAIRVSATTFKIASSYADALGDNEIDITAQGSGTHTATITYSARTLGTVGGEETHGNTVAEIGAHGHGVTHDAQKWFGNRHTNDWDTGGGPGSDVRIGFADSAITIQQTGGSQAHNNMQPFLSLNYIIKYISYT